MGADDDRRACHLGFLLAIELPQRGWVGGLLVTNPVGRPLEFQCTSPVKPDRTQEILYGPTLKPYLLAELIAGTLIEQAQHKPDLLLTQHPELFELTARWQFPVALVDPQPVQSHPRIGRQTVRLSCELTGELQALLDQVPDDADLEEPLERVTLALRETLKAA